MKQNEHKRHESNKNAVGILIFHRIQFGVTASLTCILFMTSESSNACTHTHTKRWERYAIFVQKTNAHSSLKCVNSCRQWHILKLKHSIFCKLVFVRLMCIVTMAHCVSKVYRFILWLCSLITDHHLHYVSVETEKKNDTKFRQFFNVKYKFTIKKRWLDVECERNRNKKSKKKKS